MLAGKLRAATSSSFRPFFVSSATNVANSTGVSVSAPPGIVNGDLLIAITYQTATISPATNPIVTPPSGFLQIYTELSANTRATVNVKVAASESGSYVFTSPYSGLFRALILVYRNATQVNTISGINRTSSATATALSLTPTYEGVLVASFSSSTSNSITTPPASMEQRLAPSGGALYAAVYDVPQPVATSGNKTLVWGATGDVTGIQLQVTTEPTVAPEFVASANTQNSVNSDTLTINKPTGTIQNDLMVAVMEASGNSPAWSGDTGWTEAADQLLTPSLRVAYKVAGASEGGTYTFTASKVGQILSGAILTYRYAAYDSIAGSFAVGDKYLQLASVTSSISQCILIAAGARAAASITLGTPIGMTARVTDNDATSPSSKVCDQVVAKGPSGIRSMPVDDTAGVAGIMLSIKPTRSL